MPKVRLHQSQQAGAAEEGHQFVGIMPSPQRMQPPLSPHHRSTLMPHTILGSPGHPRTRSQSIGGHPYTLGSPALPATSPYSVRSLPVSPMPMPGMLMQSKVVGPAMPFLSTMTPPEPSETRKAMEAAAATERTRSKRLEEDEKELNADELRAVLKRERARMGRIAADLAAMKSSAVQSQLEAEVIEEGRINCLMRRLDTVQKEKGRIIVELEREEEMVRLNRSPMRLVAYDVPGDHDTQRLTSCTLLLAPQLTNTLQRKLNEVRREKALLEKQIEHEKTSHADLQAQLSGLRDSHLSVAEALEEEDEIEEED